MLPPQTYIVHMHSGNSASATVGIDKIAYWMPWTFLGQLEETLI